MIINWKYLEYEKIEEARRKLKANELDKQSTTELVKKTGERNTGEFSSDEEVDDEDKYAETSDMPGQKVNTKTRTTIRNLRWIELHYFVYINISGVIVCVKSK